MRPGRHAAGDRSFGRSAGGATLRGLALLGVAVVLGIILLNTTDNPRGTTLAAGRRASASASTLPPTTTVPVRLPHDVRVAPVNGTSVNGAGARLGNTLKAAGYDVLAAYSSPQPTKDSAVLFEPGFDREAAAIAVMLNLPAGVVQPLPTPPPFDTKGASVVVWIGPDLAAASGSSTTVPVTPGRTTTTARGGTTTTARGGTTTTR